MWMALVPGGLRNDVFEENRAPAFGDAGGTVLGDATPPVLDHCPVESGSDFRRCPSSP